MAEIVFDEMVDRYRVIGVSVSRGDYAKHIEKAREGYGGDEGSWGVEYDALALMLEDFFDDMYGLRFTFVVSGNGGLPEFSVYRGVGDDPRGFVGRWFVRGVDVIDVCSGLVGEPDVCDKIHDLIGEHPEADVVVVIDSRWLSKE